MLRDHDSKWTIPTLIAHVEAIGDASVRKCARILRRLFEAHAGNALAVWADDVLDLWMSADPRRNVVQRRRWDRVQYEIELQFEGPGASELYFGPTPRAARIAAAKAIEQDLGEGCPKRPV
jgi:hypothetical protein